MAAAWALARGHVKKTVLFAIVADDGHAKYVAPPGKPLPLPPSRVEHLLKFIERPSDADGWLNLAASNLGYVHVDKAQPAASLEEAERLAQAAMASANDAEVDTVSQ